MNGIQKIALSNVGDITIARRMRPKSKVHTSTENVFPFFKWRLKAGHGE